MQITLRFLASTLGFVSSAKEPSSRADYLRAARRTYSITLAISGITHIATITIFLSSIFTPLIFAPGYAEAFHPASVLLPPFTVQKVDTIGEGALQFLQWDFVVGSLIMLLLASVGYQKVKSISGDEVNWLKFGAAVAAVTLVAGPASAYLAVNWVRDEVLLRGGEDKKDFKKAK